tara:strand:+ start:1295 stop:1735 length:441 start_codon:yes stop_codon:yes gene_type:complete
MNNFSIRHIEKKDINRDFYSLLGQLTHIDVDKMDTYLTYEFLDNLHENHQILVIENQDTEEIVGVGTLFIEKKLIRNYGKVGHIEDIVVHKKTRGTGLGKKLIEKLTEESKKQGCYKCILDCSEENVTFYEKCSYVKKGIQMGIYF